MEERRLKVLEAYNNVTAQLATIKAKEKCRPLQRSDENLGEQFYTR